MTEAINIYCDESGHLPHEGLPVMVLAAVWCPLDRARAIAAALREVKTRYGCPPGFEAKWSKVSPAGQALYLGFVDAFFDEPDLHARALVFPDKSKLDHDRFDQDHDTWYFKMYYQLLSALVDQGNRYRIYLDIKDTRSAKRVAKLHGVLANSVYDFQKRSIERIQTVHSHEVEQLQLADLIAGAVEYANRGLTSNAGKVAVVERLRKRSGRSLRDSTPLSERKLNIFRWQAREVRV